MNKRITNMILCFCILLTFFVPVYQQIEPVKLCDYFFTEDEG